MTMMTTMTTILTLMTMMKMTTMTRMLRMTLFVSPLSWVWAASSVSNCHRFVSQQNPTMHCTALFCNAPFSAMHYSVQCTKNNSPPPTMHCTAMYCLAMYWVALEWTACSEYKYNAVTALFLTHQRCSASQWTTLQWNALNYKKMQGTNTGWYWLK